MKQIWITNGFLICLVVYPWQVEAENLTEYAVFNQSKALVCPSSSVPSVNSGSMIWTLLNSGTATVTVLTIGNQTNPSYNYLYNVQVDTDDSTRYDLIINSVQSAAVYECRVSGGGNTFRFSLEIIVTPEVPTVNNVDNSFTPVRVTGREDSTISLVCQSLNGVPPATVTWQKDDTKLAKGTNTATYSLTLIRSVDGEVYTCVSSSVSPAPDQSTQVQIYLQLKPLNLIMSTISPTVEGQPLFVTCSIEDSRPAARCTWSRGDASDITTTHTYDGATNTTDVTSSLQLTANRNLNGQTVSCNTTNDALPGGDSVQSSSITVYFGPDSITLAPSGNPQIVADGTNTVTLICTTTEYNSDITIQWTDDGRAFLGAQSAINTPGGNGGKITSQTLVLTPTKEQDEHTISCTVTNTQDSTLTQTASVILDLYYAPDVDPVIEGTDPSTQLTEGQGTVSSTCIVSGGKPTPTVTLSCPGVSGTPTPGSSGGYVSSSLSFTPSRTLNRKKCSCDASQANTGWTVGTVETPIFYVKFGPDTATISGYSDQREGTTLQLTCEVSESNPSATIRWYNGSSEIQVNTAISESQGTNNGKTASQAVSLLLSHDHNGNTIKCLGSGIRTAETEQILSVLYKPYITVVKNPVTDIIEGRKLVLHCTVNSNPITVGSWSKLGGLPTSAMDVNGILTISSINRSDRGTYICTAYNSIETAQTESMYLDVLYPPDRINFQYRNITNKPPTNQPTYIVCVPDGNPNTFTFTEWTHTSIDGTRIRTLQGIDTPTQSTLSLSVSDIDFRYQNTGYYSCGVTNRLSNIQNVKDFIGQTYLYIEGLPVFKNVVHTVAGQLHASVVISLPFWSVPPYSNVVWRIDGTIQPIPTSTLRQHVYTSTVELPFHGVNIGMYGHEARLIFDQLKEDDFKKNYSVEITNGYGSRIFAFELNSASQPESPSNFSVTNVGFDTLQLEWIPGFDGGDAQTFHIDYGDSASPYSTLKSKITDNSITLSNLNPGTLYYVRLKAQNTFGDSGYVHFNETTKAEEATCQQSISFGIPFVVGFSTCAALVLVIIIGVLFIRKRHVFKNRKESREQNHSSTYTDISLASRDPGSIYDQLKDSHEVSISQHHSFEKSEIDRTNMYENTKIGSK